MNPQVNMDTATDHDLLVRLDERMSGFEKNLSLFIELVSKKADVDSVNELRNDFSQLRTDIKETVWTALGPVKDTVKENTTDIGELKKFRWILLGATSVIAALAGYAGDILKSYLQ